MKPALFISDLHLSPDRPDINLVFFRFLGGEAREAASLAILGDLFEYWAGDDDCGDPFNTEIISALAGLAASGVPVSFMHGNRDFLIGGEFARRSGTELLADPTRVDLFGTPTLLMHGDTLCTDDHEYMMFRAQVRSPAWAADFLAKPLSARKAIIAGLRRQSEDEKQKKTAAIMDVNAQAVETVLRANNYPRLIHGHTHRAARHEHQVDGHHCERWVLPDWYKTGGVLVCDAQGCRLQVL